MSEERKAISPTRQEDYPEWYQQVIKAADMAENSPVRGCMVIKPWGYGIWENIRDQLDLRIKQSGYSNLYFPLFIPLSFLEKEATHVEGFAKECAVVTHHRLELKEGKLVPSGELEEPLIVRPTSETIIGEAFSRWIESYRDLPLLVNQWANIVRWEMRPRIFLRTTEFLWQEGHSAHATEKEALEETLKMLEVYRELVEEVLALPVILGEKSPGERFPGAVKTFCLEVMTQDRKSLQAGTSHYLGQNFAKASNVRFCNKAGENEYAYTTSWGITTRLIGALIMSHGDDDGLRLPPRVSPHHAVILPFTPKEEHALATHEFADHVSAQLQRLQYHGRPLYAPVDRRDKRGGEKNWEWIKKGIPLRIEVGPREAEKKMVTLSRRDRPHKEKEVLSLEALMQKLPQILDEIQTSYFKEAKKHRDEQIYTNIESWEELKAFYTPKNPHKPEIHGGFVRAKWCGDVETEKLLAPFGVTIRCLPLEQSGTEGRCILTGKKATLDVILAKSY